MKNHIFLFQVHKQPNLFDKILTHLESPNHYFAINIDKKSNAQSEFKNIINKHKNILFVTEKLIMHGGFSQISCTINQLQMALSSSIHFDYYHTLSGQDYPCLSSVEFDKFFENNKKSYILMDKEEDYPKYKYDKYPKRLEHYYFTDELNNSICRRIHLSVIIYWLLYWIPRKYKDWESIWGGENWFSLHETVIQYLMSYVTKHPKFVKRFKYTDCADEIFFATILHPIIHQYNIETRSSSRYVDWYPDRYYTSLPLILNEKDYEKIMNSKKLFCRKVDEKLSAKLLDKLDKKISI